MALSVSTTYSDLSLSFLSHPGSGDILKKTDLDAVMSSMQFILLAGPFASPFDPNFGGNIQKLLFEPITPTTIAVIKRQILLALSEYEPRCTVQDVFVGNNPINPNKVDIGIQFFVVGNPQSQSVSFSLNRVR